MPQHVLYMKMNGKIQENLFTFVIWFTFISCPRNHSHFCHNVRMCPRDQAGGDRKTSLAALLQTVNNKTQESYMPVFYLIPCCVTSLQLNSQNKWQDGLGLVKDSFMIALSISTAGVFLFYQPVPVDCAEKCLLYDVIYVCVKPMMLSNMQWITMSQLSQNCAWKGCPLQVWK